MMEFKPYSANYFKPGLPYYGKVGDHAPTSRLMVRNFTTDLHSVSFMQYYTVLSFDNYSYI